MRRDEAINLLRKEQFKNSILERQVEYLLAELVDIHEGVGVKPSWYGLSNKWEVALQHKAGLAIKKLHEMRK